MLVYFEVQTSLFLINIYTVQLHLRVFIGFIEYSRHIVHKSILIILPNTVLDMG